MPGGSVDGYPYKIRHLNTFFKYTNRNRSFSSIPSYIPQVIAEGRRKKKEGRRKKEEGKRNRQSSIF
jgi:hypothetical protein